MIGPLRNLFPSRPRRPNPRQPQPWPGPSENYQPGPSYPNHQPRRPWGIWGVALTATLLGVAGVALATARNQQFAEFPPALTPARELEQTAKPGRYSPELPPSPVQDRIDYLTHPTEYTIDSPNGSGQSDDPQVVLERPAIHRRLCGGTCFRRSK